MDYRDGVILYICPVCKEEYTIFGEMMDCFKGCLEVEIQEQ